jgi:hypothetical protein
LLPGAVKDVTMIDRALELEDPNLAESAFALPAVEHHFRAGFLESFKHGPALSHGNFQSECRNLDDKFFRVVPAAVAEGFVAEVGVAQFV